LFKEVILKLANLGEYSCSDESVAGGYQFTVKGHEYFIISDTLIDSAEEKSRLTKDLNYNKGFLKSVQIKLSNQKFVANAKPEIIAMERKKESDARAITFISSTQKNGAWRYFDFFSAKKFRLFAEFFRFYRSRF